MLVGLSKFLLGFTLAVAILLGAGVIFTNFLIGRLSSLPARPTFPNDLQPKASAVQPDASPEAAKPEEAPAPIASPAQGYTAKVTQPIGLLVRAEASADSSEVGGVAFEEEVTVLETSTDGGWERIKLNNGTEGWVKGGNTEKLN
jgi:Bacterial SH3 domain